VSARRAALSYLDRPYNPDDFIGVFLVDQSLHTVQTYTNDRIRLREAIEAVGRYGTSSFGRESSRIRAEALGDRNPATSPTAGAESPGQAGPASRPPPGQGGGLEELNRLVESMERNLEEIGNEQQGAAVTRSLRALVASLGVLPGRKTVVCFGEGLPLPDSALRSFEILVELANQRNVAIYTVDAAGLRAHSTQAAAGRVVSAAGDDLSSISGAPDAASAESMTDKFDRGFTAARSEAHASLARLADLTGGFLVENTNNLKAGLDRIESDRRFHYLLTYSPKNTDFRGEYRRLAVTVKRKDVRVRSRNGYSALHEPGVFPTLTYEATPLALLARTPAPNELPATLQTFRLPQPEYPGRLALIVRVPARSLTFSVDADGVTYRSDFTILARITDAKGEPVRKASQPYRLTVPASRLETTRAGDIVFFRSPELPPGAYTVSYVVYDALADRASVGSTPIEVDARGPNELVVSDVVIVDRAERLPAVERDPTNPLIVADSVLYPRGGSSGSTTSGNQPSEATTLPFYVSVRPDRRRPPPTARLAIARARHTVAQLPLTLDAPAADGVIRQLSRIDVGGLPPGAYSLVLTITDGASTTIRSAPFTR
jgi:VWFA-related protein